MYRPLLAVALIPFCLPAQDKSKWSGPVQVLPASLDRQGFWQVGGRIVQITAASVVDQDRGPIQMGSCVDVDATSNGENMVATTVQPQFGQPGCASAARGGGGSSELRGILQDAASFGPTQRWRVNGRRVNVNPSTQLASPGFPQVGECVAIEGNVESEGTIAARRVEKLALSGCAAAPGADDPKILGRIDTLPSGGPFGEWRVYGQPVRVGDGTMLETRRGDFRQGSCVEARGEINGGAFVANYVKNEDPGDCDRLGAFEIRGTLESRPGNLTGNWIVGGRTYAANPTTVLDLAKGNAIAGACVDIDARRNESGGFDAVRIEVLSTSGLCLNRDGALNAASFEDLALAPNQIVSVFGRNLGPANQAFFELNANLVSTRLANTSVLFDNAPGAVLFASRGQLNVVTPCALSGKTSALVQVESTGAWTQSVRVPVLPAAPGIFTMSGSGRGPGAVLNYDPNSQRYDANSAGNRAPRGSVVAIYATGLGDTDRGCVDGGVNPSNPPFAKPVLPLRVLIGDREARIEFAGPAPGFVRGVFQINVTVPGDAPLGPNVPLTVEAGGTRSQDGVTLAVK